MKLIYYGLFDKPSDCENWICKALNRAGVLVYRWQKSIGKVNSDWNDFISYVGDNQIDIVLISKAPSLKPFNIQELKLKTNCKVVWWTFDWMNNPTVKNWYFPLAKVSDICFQTDGFGENELYKSEGINKVELHQGVDPDTQNNYLPLKITEEDEQLYSADIAFFGSLYTPRRKDLHNFLTQNYGSKYKIWGGPDRFEKGLWNLEFRKAIKCTKIIIGDNFVNDIPGYWSDRVYITLACGGFFLTSYVPGLEKEFNFGEDLDVWYNFTDLKIKIDRYLGDGNSRNKISRSGNYKVGNEHTYDNRVKIFLEKIKELK